LGPLPCLSIASNLAPITYATTFPARSPSSIRTSGTLAFSMPKALGRRSLRT
jgi:hypothetical protein